MSAALKLNTVLPEMRSTQARKFRVEFYGITHISESGERKSDSSYVTLVIRTEQIPDLLGIAFKRAQPKCLTATSVRILEL